MTLEVQIMIVVDHLQVESDGVALHSTTALNMIIVLHCRLFVYICSDETVIMFTCKNSRKKFASK
jgi:hypothetical protein